MNMWEAVENMDLPDLIALIEGMDEENRITDEMIREACRTDSNWVRVVE
jgi:hypothetical protein